MVNGGWIEYRFISGSKKFRSTRIGIDPVLDPRSVCSLISCVITAVTFLFQNQPATQGGMFWIQAVISLLQSQLVDGSTGADESISSCKAQLVIYKDTWQATESVDSVIIVFTHCCWVLLSVCDCLCVIEWLISTPGFYRYIPYALMTQDFIDVEAVILLERD